jgi:hypothetical protein
LTEDYLAETYGVKFEELPQQDTSSTDSLQGLLDGSSDSATGADGAIAADPGADATAPTFEELSIEYQEALAVLESMDAIEYAESSDYQDAIGVLIDLEYQEYKRDKNGRFAKKTAEPLTQ